MAENEKTPPKTKSHGKPPSSARPDRMIAEAVVERGKQHLARLEAHVKEKLA